MTRVINLEHEICLQ